MPHRTAHALSAPLKGARGALRAVEDFGSDPSRVPALPIADIARQEYAYLPQRRADVLHERHEPKPN